MNPDNQCHIWCPEKPTVETGMYQAPHQVQGLYSALYLKLDVYLRIHTTILQGNQAFDKFAVQCPLTPKALTKQTYQL